MLAEIVRNNRLEVFPPDWRDHIKRWEDTGYSCKRDMNGRLVIGAGASDVKVLFWAHGIKVYSGFYQEPLGFMRGTPTADIVSYVDGVLPAAAGPTEDIQTEQDAEGRIFAWKDWGRSTAIKLVTARMMSGEMNLEQATVDILSRKSASSVCYGFQYITTGVLTLFVNECWDAYRATGRTKQKSKDGEIQRILAALTRTEPAEKEKPAPRDVRTPRVEQMTLFA